MAFGRLERSTGASPMSDINMTPLIDVMLVLLVIFMITAPLLASAIKLELPTSGAAKPDNAPAFVQLVLDPAGALLQSSGPSVHVPAPLPVAHQPQPTTGVQVPQPL